MSNGLKTVFIIHAIVSVIFGIWLFFAPGSWANANNWTPFDPAVTRTLGALFLALAFQSYLGFRAKAYSQVRIIVQMEIALTLLGVLAGLYEALISTAPAAIWINIVIFAAFAIAWIAVYSNSEKAKQS